MNVCPNCGGGFERRPIRPSNNYKDNNNLENNPAVVHKRHKPKNIAEHQSWALNISPIPPAER